MQPLHLLSLLWLIAATHATAQWTGFRGPNGSGVDSGTGYPVEFSPSKNFVWKTSVPFGQSSPVIVGGRLFLTASDRDRLLTIGRHASPGKGLWRRGIYRQRAHKPIRTIP